MKQQQQYDSYRQVYWRSTKKKRYVLKNQPLSGKMNNNQHCKQQKSFNQHYTQIVAFEGKQENNQHAQVVDVLC